MNNYIHSEITQKIIGCAMKVHNILGTGFQEVIYQRSLAIEMGKQQKLFEREKELKIYNEGIEVGTRRVDFMVDDKIMVELKALSDLEDVHMAQTLNYLEASKLEVGLLINFGATKLQKACQNPWILKKLKFRISLISFNKNQNLHIKPS